MSRPGQSDYFTEDGTVTATGRPAGVATPTGREAAVTACTTAVRTNGAMGTPAAAAVAATAAYMVVGIRTVTSTVDSPSTKGG